MKTSTRSTGRTVRRPRTQGTVPAGPEQRFEAAPEKPAAPAAACPYCEA